MTGLQRDARQTANAPRLNTRVLIVDDQEEIHDDFREMLLPSRTASAELLADFLGQKHSSSAQALPTFDLRHARSGGQGCKAIQQGREGNEPIAVAFVDIRLPPGDRRRSSAQSLIAKLPE